MRSCAEGDKDESPHDVSFYALNDETEIVHSDMKPDGQ